MKERIEEFKVIDKFYTKEFNSLPINKRKKISIYNLQRQILDYEIEKARAVETHKKHLEKINSHLNNCKKDLVYIFRTEHPIKEL